MRLPLSAAVLLLVFLAIYLPDAGHGFIKDDFRWVRENRLSSVGDVAAAFSRNVGFYRPLVSLSFAANHRVSGLNPLGYGLTNLAIALLNAGLLYALARRLTLPASAAILGTAVWLFNFHGINMAILWLSGRTALLACLFSLCTAHAWMSRLHVLAAVSCLCALFCKEEAVLIPAFFSALAFLDVPGSSRTPRAAFSTWPLWLSLAVYAVLRAGSGAFGPVSAPTAYQFTFVPLAVARNVLEYLDRGASLAIAMSAVLVATARRLPRMSEPERGVLVYGACWFAAFYLITIFLPVRSSLYATLPSIGSALIAAGVASAAARVEPTRFARAATGLLILTIVLIPIYRQRNIRWVALADLSAGVMRQIQLAASAQGPMGSVVLVDDMRLRNNLDATFGSALTDAMVTHVGEGWTGTIVPSLDEAISTPHTLAFRLAEGRLVRAPAAGPR